MKNKILFSVFVLITGSAIAADANLKNEMTAAIQKLTQKGSYSWKSTIEFGNFTGGTEGKIDKESLIGLSMSFGDTKTEAFLKNGKGAVKPQDEDWQSLSELAVAAGTEPGPKLFLVRRLQSFKAPATEAADLVDKTKEMKKDGDTYSGELTEAGAKELLSFGFRRGSNAPEPKNAKGSVKFWLKDGTLSKYQLNLQGTVNFNGEDRDIDRTTTYQIKDVGTTNVDIPEAAKKKLS
jgi:hypothetical protein